MEAAHATHGARRSGADGRAGGHETVRGPVPGIVFVPCVYCLEPVDLAVVRETGGRPMCGPHRAATGLRLS